MVIRVLTNMVNSRLTNGPRVIGVAPTTSVGFIRALLSYRRGVLE